MTTYNTTAKNTTTFSKTLGLGKRTPLLTDALETILVGENEDQELILWDSTSFSTIAKN